MSSIVARSNPDMIIGGVDSFLRGNEYFSKTEQDKKSVEQSAEE